MSRARRGNVHFDAGDFADEKSLKNSILTFEGCSVVNKIKQSPGVVSVLFNKVRKISCSCIFNLCIQIRVESFKMSRCTGLSTFALSYNVLFGACILSVIQRDLFSA